MNARVAAVEDLESRIGHTFTDRDLLERALTHASVGDGAREVRHNERLEFLGDRVLNLCAAERLMALDPDSREGEMSRRLAALVNYHACARAAERAGLPAALRLSASATKVGARKSDAVLGDACEALIAALYIDGGLETAKAFFEKFWAEEFVHLDTPRGKDPKTQLQEWAQGLGLPLPAYEVVQREGPAHAPVFTVEVRVKGFEPERGEGGSRQAAEKAAAQVMLLKREGVESEAGQ
ncbi:MAG: ribonuclease III [Phenylobacterium sp.]|jgi:ribonuclease-3|uniref:ribonuclease III n=1 Tax=unclassified Phenylobacterium TaxID=2640670 RepID=UPI0008ACB236|nr:MULTISPECIES: ribonuclease III [unclassified Phenylobacterium]MBJ7411757.1 ribonuclease III [Phenylobacterium sp.]OHB27206.1 MAG: ribonuclease III [Phenylobacterium sp. RIFCSPHIGHO2_01_FULL_69_31]